MTDLRPIPALNAPYVKPTDTRVAAVNCWQMLQIAAGACRELDPAAESVALDIQVAAGQRIVALFGETATEIKTENRPYTNSDPFANWDRGPQTQPLVTNVKPLG